jgi:diphthamide synthase (EF-2-diphthine--ammonia ligase)
MSEDIEDITVRHDAAERAGEPSYVDPKTGYRVFTASFLQGRKKCCGCGCRHCPYNHANVPMEKRAERIKAPALLWGNWADLEGGCDGVDVLLWSGGKDSFLAARALCRERGSRRGLLLLTTFDGGSRQVAHQEVQIELICRQAESLQLPVLGCPLFPHVRYEQRVEQALQLAAKSSPLPLRRICSGDLHLEHILQWRAEHIGPLAAAVGASLHAPLWNVPYKTLLHDLAASGVPCRVCATNGAVALGTRFDAALVAQLPAGTDAFGENGEFHTLAEVMGAPNMRVPPQHALFCELTVVIAHPGLGCAGWCGPFACIERAVEAAGSPKALMN